MPPIDAPAGRIPPCNPSRASLICLHPGIQKRLWQMKWT